MALLEEHLFPVAPRPSPSSVQRAEQIQLGGRREIEDVHELGHEMDLAAPFQDVHAFLRGDHRVAVEIGRPLLEFGEIFHALQRPLRAEQPLDVHPAQPRRIEAMAELLGTDVAHEVRGAVGVSIHVAVEAGHARARLQGPPVVRGVELLLRERRHQQPQALQLLGVQEPVEKLEVVGQRDHLALRDVAQVGTRREDRWPEEIPAGGAWAGRSRSRNG